MPSPVLLPRLLTPALTPEQGALRAQQQREQRGGSRRCCKSPSPLWGQRGPAWSFPQGILLLQNGPPAPACFPTPHVPPLPPAGAGREEGGDKRPPARSLSVPRAPPRSLEHRMETAPFWKCCPPRNKAATCAISRGFLPSSGPQAKNLRAVAMGTLVTEPRGQTQTSRRPGRHTPALGAALLETALPSDPQHLPRGVCGRQGVGGLPLWPGTLVPGLLAFQPTCRASGGLDQTLCLHCAAPQKTPCRPSARGGLYP